MKTYVNEEKEIYAEKILGNCQECDFDECDIFNCSAGYCWKRIDKPEESEKVENVKEEYVPNYFLKDKLTIEKMISAKILTDKYILIKLLKMYDIYEEIEWDEKTEEWFHIFAPDMLIQLGNSFLVDISKYTHSKFVMFIDHGNRYILMKTNNSIWNWVNIDDWTFNYRNEGFSSKESAIIHTIKDSTINNFHFFDKLEPILESDRSQKTKNNIAINFIQNILDLDDIDNIKDELNVLIKNLTQINKKE